MTSNMPSGADGEAGPVKNIIVMVADGGGFNTLEAVRDYLGDPHGGPQDELAVDGDDFVRVAQSTFRLERPRCSGDRKLRGDRVLVRLI